MTEAPYEFVPTDPSATSALLLDPPPGRRWADENLDWLVGLGTEDGLTQLGVPFVGDHYGTIVRVDALGDGKLLVMVEL